MLYSIGKLIQEVQKHEAIWNMTSKTYLDKNIKAMAWQTVLGEIYPEWPTFTSEQRLEYGYELQKKWKNIRDSFMKEFKRQKKISMGVKDYKMPRKKYIYYDYLTFLIPQYEMKRSDRQRFKKSDVDEDTNSDDSSNVSQKPLPLELPPISRADTSQSASVTMPVTKKTRFGLNTSSVLQKSNDVAIDEDTAFFNSIVPSVRKLNDDQKLEFRMEVLQALKRVKQQSSQQNEYFECSSADQGYSGAGYPYSPETVTLKCSPPGSEHSAPESPQMPELYGEI